MSLNDSMSIPPIDNIGVDNAPMLKQVDKSRRLDSQVGDRPAQLANEPVA